MISNGNEEDGIVTIIKGSVNRVVNDFNSSNDGSRNLGIDFDITFLVVVGDSRIRQIDDKFLVKFADGQVRSVGAVDDFEAVVEQSLALVVDYTQQFDGSPGAARGGTCPRHTEGDVVNSTRFQGEGACRLHETTVVRSILALLF